jgi:ABC-type glutathione transport system ATPase component
MTTNPTIPNSFALDDARHLLFIRFLLASFLMALVEVRNLTKVFGHDVRAVDGVSLEIRAGETLGLVGESGSGKSTIARMVLGLIEPTAGSVVFDRQPVTSVSQAKLRSLRRRMQPVFQDPYAALNPRMRVEEIVTEPLAIHDRGMGKAQRRERCTELLGQVGLDASAMRRYPHEFSGGQRQRINIARALALRPELLVLDEPVSALDVSVGAQVVNLLRDLQREFGLTYLFISHSMPLVRYLSTKIAVLRGGKLVEMGGRDAVCESPREEYTRNLVAATPEIAVS